MKHLCIEYENTSTVIISRDNHYKRHENITPSSKSRIHHIANNLCVNDSLGKSELKIHTRIYECGWAVLTSKVLPGNREIK
jgi:hypothetical protein